MANDKRRSRKVKNDNRIKSNKRTVPSNASHASKSRPSDTSSSRRSSRETPSKKQTKENTTNTRKSERLENMKPSGTPIKENSERTQEQMITTPMKRYDRRKKHTSLCFLKSENSVEKPASSNKKLKKGKFGRSSKQSVMDTSEEKSHKNPGVDVGGNKRKRETTCINKALSKPQQLKSDSGDDNDSESQDKPSQANSSSSRDVDKELKTPEKLRHLDNRKNRNSGSESPGDKDGDGEECSDKTGEASMLKASKSECSTSHSSLRNSDVIEIYENDQDEVEGSCLACSKKQRTNHGLGKHQELDYCDTTHNTHLCDTSSSKVRTRCEAAGLVECVEKNDMSRMTTSICYACKLGGKLRYCDAIGCNRCYHLSCLDPPLNNVPSGSWRCPFCVKYNKSIVPSVSGVTESIWDTRDVEVSCAEGLRKQKQYFVKYKGLAHIHNQWVTDTPLLLEAPLLVEPLILLPYSDSLRPDGSMQWNEEWTVPHKLLKRRLLLSFKPLYNSQQDTGKVLNYHYEWLVQWQGLGYEQATWEAENISVLDSPEGHKLIKEYEKHHGNTQISASPDVKIEELPVRLPTIPAGCPPGMDNIHLNYVKNLHDAWNTRQNSIVFDDQDWTTRIVLFLLSLNGVTLPFLLITTSSSISRWEAMFLKIAPCNSLKVFLEGHRSTRLLQVQKEGGQLSFQVLLYPVDAFIKDRKMLKTIKWEAVIVDESQSLEISACFSRIKSLSTNKRLLVFCGQLSVCMFDVLSLLDSDGALRNCGISKTELNDISKLKETLSEFIAYESKSSSSKFVEFWVPVQISNVQLERYCFMLLSNAMALSSCSKSDTVGALHDILVSNRKCCDHPYIVDQRLQGVMTKDLEPVKYLDVGIKASGKLQFLDLILPEMRKRQLRVLILFQPLSGSGKDSTSIGDILDDFVRQRFGADSYERIDAIGTIPSKKQAALNNFNNKEMDRFIFLLEYRACLPSIKLSSVDTIVIFDSDWNPANDLRALQKVAIDSQSQQIMIFRLYTSWTLEEKILRLAEHNVTIDSKLQNLSRSTSDALLMWGATYLFKKLAEFHSASEPNGSSEEERFWNELMEEFLNLISHECKNKDPASLKITRVQSISGTYAKDLPTKMPDGEQPHRFWKNLLFGKNPSWKYLSISTPRLRKRPQFFEESRKKTNSDNDDAGRKRKKTSNNIVETLSSKPVTDESENTGACTGAAKVLSHGRSQPSPGDNILCAAKCDETSFRDLLKLNISKLCEVLRLSEDVKIMVERFLDYVIENYHVNKEPANTLQAFLISLCWIGSASLKHKLDRRESLSLANEHLNFSCKEEEVNSVYLKLEPAKEMFVWRIENHKKTDVSKDSIPAAAQATSTRFLDPMMSPSGSLNLQQVKAEIPESPHSSDQNDISCNDVEGHAKGMPAVTTSPQTSDVEDQNDSGSFNSSPSPSAAALNERVSSVQPLVSPASDQPAPSSDHAMPQSRVNMEQHPVVSAESPSLEINTEVQNHAATPPAPNLSNVQGASRMHCQFPSSSNPLEAELEKLHDLKDSVIKYHEAIKLKLKSDHDKELEELIAQMNRKYEAKRQDADTAFQLKKKEIDINYNRVVMNKILADAFKSKCQELNPSEPAGIQVARSGGMQHSRQITMQPSFTGAASGIQQVTKLQPPLQIVNQPAKLFSTAPRQLSPNTNPPTIPTKPPSNFASISPTSTPSRPPPNLNPPTPSTGPRPPPNVNHITPSSKPSRPPPNIPSTTPSARNLRVTEYRSPAPHIRPFKPSTSVSPRVMSSQLASSSLPLSSPTFSQASPRPPLPPSLQTPPPFPENHNDHPIQNSPRSLPTPSPLAAQASSQPPGNMPVTCSSLPPMPSISISHSGLYTTSNGPESGIRLPSPDILSLPALDLLMDIDKQAGFHQPNMSPSPPEFFNTPESGDVVCLSDDD